MTETKSMDRIIRILDDELTLLMDSGLYREAEKTRARLEEEGCQVLFPYLPFPLLAPSNFVNFVGLG